MTIKSFFEELQSLEETTKRKVLITTTIVVMLIVVYFWLGYFNGLVASDQTSPSQVSETGQSQNQNGSMLANVGNSIAGGFQSMIHMFQSPGQYTISPSHQ